MTSQTQTPLALHGGSPIRPADKAWPAWPVHDEAERQAVLEVLESGNWFRGDRVAKFEREFAEFQGGRFCVSCTSGTTALELILNAFDIGPGDEVIIPPYTFIATASAVVRMGARPVFVDLDASWCLDPNLVEAAITPRTKAIMPVHFAGRVCDMDALNNVAQEHGLALIEDACHSWGARWKGAGTGTLGDCGAFSFQMSKNMTAGEGGAIITNDEKLAERLTSISNCGRDAQGPWYHHVRIGTNARLTEISAAILSAQLTRLDEQNQLRDRNAAILNAALSEIEGLTPQPGSNRITKRAYHLYCLKIDAQAFGCSRERFVEAARAEGFPIDPGYPSPLYKQPALLACPGHDYSAYHCPVVEDLCEKSGMWCTHPMLLAAEEDMEDIIRIVRKIKKNTAALRD